MEKQMLKNSNITRDNVFVNSLMIRGIFWMGSLMLSSSATWLFTSLQDWNDVNSLKIPIIFLVIGITLIIMFKDCQFFIDKKSKK